MSQRVTKCTVCGEVGHTLILCLDVCSTCSADSCKCGCEQPPAKKKKTMKKRAAKSQPQLPVASTAVSPPPPPPPSATSTPESDVNYKSLCRQLQLKNQQLGKAYKDIKAKFDALEQKCQEKEDQLQQVQEDSDEMAQFVREAEERVASYQNKVKDGNARINELERQLRELQNKPPSNSELPAAPAKVDRNDEEVHQRYGNVLSVIREKKCSLNNAYRMAGTARSTIRDFLGIAELRIVNDVTYNSTIERLADPKLSVKAIELECRRQLEGLLPIMKRLRMTKKLLPLAVDDSFYS